MDPVPKTPIDILHTALAREREAHRFYDSLLRGTHAPIMAELLTQLREEEQRHIRMIENRIAQMRLG